VDECEKVFASARCSPKGKASGNPSADNPDEYGEIVPDFLGTYESQKIRENFAISYESG